MPIRSLGLLTGPDALCLLAGGPPRPGDAAAVEPAGVITLVDCETDLMIGTGGKNLPLSASEGAVPYHPRSSMRP
ncbi:hypothetical protein [Streptomyces sp. NPDC001100]